MKKIFLVVVLFAYLLVSQFESCMQVYLRVYNYIKQVESHKEESLDLSEIRTGNLFVTNLKFWINETCNFHGQSAWLDFKIIQRD